MSGKILILLKGDFLDKDKQSSLVSMTVIVDVVLVGFSFVIAYWEKRSLPGELASLGPLMDYGWIFMSYLVLVVGALYFSGFYTFSRTQTIPDIVLGIVRSAGLAFGLVILILFMVKEQSISRLFLGLFSLNSALLLIVAKIAYKQVIRRMQKSGVNVINAIVIGSEKPAEKLINNLFEQFEFGYKVHGCLDPEKERVGRKVGKSEVIGSTDQLAEIIEKYSIDEVFVAMPVYKIRGMNKIMYLCEEVGIRLSLIADWLKPNIAKTVVRNFLDSPVITYTSTPTAVGQLIMKEIFDRILSALLLIFSSPVFLLISVSIKVTSPGAAIFQQTRAGLNGRNFQMLKFRTMIKNAEAMKEKLEGQNEMDGPVFKIKDDPRVTKVGKFLRKTSLDELPQLINVVRGEMSLVGPRPPVPQEVSQYERWQRRRLSMKPGITCFWQISGRNEVTFEDWMTLDLKYIDNWSFGLDLIILIKTIPIVLTGKGAS